jgi:anti-sigma regulatory factor (Ser/Thr protein kinase)
MIVELAWSHHDTWSATPASVAESRAFVAGHLREHDLAGLVEGARVVVSELATNAVRHAGTPYTVTLECLDGVVLLRVEDGSPLLPSQPAPSDGLRLRGRGLMLVESLSDHWGVALGTGGGKTVWARLPVTT